jgi:hypothetical protein
MGQGAKGDLEGRLARLVTSLREGHADDLQSVVLYGSAAAGDEVPGVSDVNLLILLREVTPAALRQARKALTVWPTQPPLSPLFLSPSELAASADVFPIEFLDMKERHRVLWGDDPLRDLIVAPADVRRQLEAELRGKWLRLRQAYLRDAGDAVSLRSLMRESLSSFQVLFAAALGLGEEAHPPRRSQVFARAGETFGLDAEVMRRAVEVKESRSGWPDDAMEGGFERYMQAVEQVLTWVDRWAAEQPAVKR